MSHTLSVYKQDNSLLTKDDLEKLQNDFDVKKSFYYPDSEDLSAFSLLYKNDNGKGLEWFSNGIELVEQEDEKHQYSAICEYEEEEKFMYFYKLMNTVANILDLVLYDQITDSEESGTYYASGY